MGSFLYKKANTYDVGVTRLYFVQSLVVLPFLLIPGILLWQPVEGPQILWAAGSGVTFFVGWLFSMMAIRVGDVSLQTPLMGMKVTFVALLTVLLGTRDLSADVWTSVILATVAVFIMGFPRRARPGRVLNTIIFATLASVSFAISDVVIGAHAPAFGPIPFLAVMVSVNAVLAFALIPFFREPLHRISTEGWRWTALGVGVMVLQVLTLVIYMAVTGKAAEANIFFSLRGLFAVLFGGYAARLLLIQTERLDRVSFVQRLIGAVLMSVSIVILLA